jgi:DNA-binding response OmpR family regulator
MVQPVVLVVDDDRRYRDLIGMNLTRAGYAVVHAGEGLAGLNMLEQHRPDLVILDLLLPDLDGYEVCDRIRQYSQVPVIMLSARAESSSKVRGLRLGADDYVTKPFAADELLARITAVLRRTRPASASDAERLFTVGDLSIDLLQHRVTIGNREIPLTRQEYRLLYHLALNAGQVMVQEEILRRAWGPAYTSESELLHTTIRRLRVKIEDDPALPSYVRTRRGIGYLLTSPDVN